MELMKDVKAIMSGSIFIGVSILVLQLVVLFAMVAYNIAAKDYPFLKDISGDLYRYLLGIPIFIIVMFLGGYLTAAVGQGKVLQNCLMVGVITSAATMFLALENAVLTTTGIVMIVLMIGATVLGGMYWQRRQSKQHHGT